MLYLVQAPSVDENENLCYILKVGFTEDENFERRMREYKSYIPTIKILGTIEKASRLHETAIHRRFSEIRLDAEGSKEWYYYSQELIDFFFALTDDIFKRLEIEYYSTKTSKRYKRDALCCSILNEIDDSVLEGIILDYFELDSIVDQLKFLQDHKDNQEFLEALPEDELAKKLFNYFGFEKCKALKFCVKELLGIIEEETSNRFIEMENKIKSSFVVREKYSSVYIKSIIKKIYDEYDYKAVVKATSLQKWFETKATKVKEGDLWLNGFETFWKKYCNGKLPRVHPAFGVTKKWQFLDLPVVKRALKMFDVPEEEITKKKIELVQEWRESSEAWYKKVKAKETEVKVEFDLHGNRAEEVKEWLEEHGKQFSHRIS